MLFKWLLTALLIIWLIRAIQPFFPPPPPPSGGKGGQGFVDDEGAYIDYEEIK
jgi:hypothetical protein